MADLDPTPTPRVDLEELVAEGRRLRELLAEATERPWLRGGDSRPYVHSGPPANVVVSMQHRPCDAVAEADAALIVAAVNVLPDLLEAVEYAGRCEKALAAISAHQPHVGQPGRVPCGYCQHDDHLFTCPVSIARAALARPHPDEEAAQNLPRPEEPHA